MKIILITSIIIIIGGMRYFYTEWKNRNESLRENAIRKLGKEKMEKLVDDVSDKDLKESLKRALDIKE